MADRIDHFDPGVLRDAIDYTSLRGVPTGLQVGITSGGELTVLYRTARSRCDMTLGVREAQALRKALGAYLQHVIDEQD